MTELAPYVIVGAGLAGGKAAEALRDAGFDGPVTLVGAEQHPPYERPALSKGFLAGSEEVAKLAVHAPDWYADHDVQLLLGTRVTGLDRRAHAVVTSDDERLQYSKLLLATGSAPRRLDLPGSDLRGVRYLRTLEDSLALKTAFVAGARVVVIGAGWIGLETAAVARAAGAHVVVLEHSDLPLRNVLGPRLGHVFADLHRSHGVDLRCGVSVTELCPRRDDGTHVGGVVVSGEEVSADVVVVGVGATPNDQLARDAGLRVDNGVVVDGRLRTSDPDVFAAGDVANAYHPRFGRHIRVEHWATAMKQPATAARAMLGHDTVYDAMPYFFTDQYDLGMEYVGHVSPDDEASLVVRGDLESRTFVAFWLQGRRLLAGMHVNAWDDFDAVKTLVRSEADVDPSHLADHRVALTDLL